MSETVDTKLARDLRVGDVIPGLGEVVTRCGFSIMDKERRYTFIRPGGGARFSVLFDEHAPVDVIVKEWQYGSYNDQVLKPGVKVKLYDSEFEILKVSPIYAYAVTNGVAIVKLSLNDGLIHVYPDTVLPYKTQ